MEYTRERFTYQEKQQWITDMNSYGQFTMPQAETMADNLERMHRDYSVLYDRDSETTGEIALFPNEHFENWFYQQDASSRQHMSTKQMFKRYNQMCIASGGRGYIGAG